MLGEKLSNYEDFFKKQEINRKFTIFFWEFNYTFNETNRKWSLTKISLALYLIQGVTFDELLTIIFRFLFHGF